jgi:hypothetical protein
MITITFTPETPEQLAAVAQAMAAYLGVAAQGETVADEAPKPAVRRVRKAAAAEDSASVAGQTETAAPTETTQATEDPKPAAETSEPEVPASAPAPEVSLEQVRAKLVVISQAGKGSAVAGLLTNKYGVKNLTAVPKDQLAALLADAEAL